MLLFFDTETTDRVVLGVYPICIQLAWATETRENVTTRLVKTDARIAPGAQKIHGISAQKLKAEGEEPARVYADFLQDVRACTHLVAHNAQFDRNVILRSLRHARVHEDEIRMFENKPFVCTMRLLTPVTKLPHTRAPAFKRARASAKPRYKWPKLCEAADFFGLDFDSDAAHDAGYDVQMLKRVYQCMARHPAFKTTKKALRPK